jgi:STE24 endopeptidase
MKRIIFICFVLISCFLTCEDVQAEPDTLSVQAENIENFDAIAATQEYLDMLTPEQKAKSDAYFEGGYWIILWDFLVSIVIAWIFLSLGLSARINRIASKAKKINVKNLLYILIYLFFAFLLAFPWSIYTGFVREHKYGLSNMTFFEWLSETMISLMLLLIFGSLLIMVLYIVMRKTDKHWWIWGSGVAAIFAVFGLFITPVFISPLFNNYKPLEEGAVKEEILSLARANGVPVDNVYWFDASKQSTRISANVSGIGSTIRVSLNDNLLNKCTLAEIKSVMAHELGHYVLNHMYKLLIYLSLVVIIGFAFVNLVMKKLIARFGARWGIKSISDITSLPLFVVVFSFYILIATPAINNISRVTESEADIFGLNAAREPDGFAAVSIKLSEYRKIAPGRLEEIIFFDHPAGKTRILMSMKWKAENIRKR